MELEAKTPRDVSSFLEAQALASRRLGFSVTKACPLRCNHCSVSASPELASTTFRLGFAKLISEQLSDLSRVGITSIDFTGGEPTLAADFVTTVSQGSKAVGISTGIVTAAHWATNDNSGARFLEKFADIDNWDISTDIYHLPFVSLAQVERAYRLLAELGKPPMIRVAYHDPMTLPEAELIDRVRQFAGKRMSFQPIGPVGRGEDLVSASLATQEDYDQTPCPSTGPLVQTDGTVAPCCAPVSHEEYDHPLRLGNANEESLVAIVQQWRTHPLLQTIRLWGFEPIFKWMADDPLVRTLLRKRQCDTCVAMTRNAEFMRRAADLASSLENRVRIAATLKTYFDEPWMEESLLSEARAFIGSRQ